MWRRLCAFAAAYLLVAQAAFAGVAAQRMQLAQDGPGGLAGAVICLNGQPTPAGDSGGHTPFDCCGLGCLVGAQLLASPAAPDEALSYPQSRRFAPQPTAAAVHGDRAERIARRPRGPPAYV